MGGVGMIAVALLQGWMESEGSSDNLYSITSKVLYIQTPNDICLPSTF